MWRLCDRGIPALSLSLTPLLLSGSGSEEAARAPGHQSEGPQPAPQLPWCTGHCRGPGGKQAAPLRLHQAGPGSSPAGEGVRGVLVPAELGQCWHLRVTEEQSQPQGHSPCQRHACGHPWLLQGQHPGHKDCGTPPRRQGTARAEDLGRMTGCSFSGAPSQSWDSHSGHVGWASGHSSEKQIGSLASRICTKYTTEPQGCVVLRIRQWGQGQCSCFRAGPPTTKK